MKESSFKIDFTGIGAPKAGTTLVANWLVEHPEICFAEPKEPHYFNKISAYIHPQPNPNFAEDLTWYAKHFAHKTDAQIKGEFSTGYMYDIAVAKRLYQHNPKLKIIACLRHPAERAHSQYIMFRYYFKKENLPFEEAIKQHSEFIEKGLYYEMLEPYFEIFPKEQIKILFLENLKDNAENSFVDLCDFLKIDNTFRPNSLRVVANSAKSVKNPAVSKIMGIFTKTMVKLGLSGMVKSLKDAGLKDWVIGLNSKRMNYPPMSEKAKKYILAQTVSDTEKLEEYLNINLSHWKK